MYKNQNSYNSVLYINRRRNAKSIRKYSSTIIQNAIYVTFSQRPGMQIVKPLHAGIFRNEYLTQTFPWPWSMEAAFHTIYSNNPNPENTLANWIWLCSVVWRICSIKRVIRLWDSLHLVTKIYRTNFCLRMYIFQVYLGVVYYSLVSDCLKFLKL